MPSYIGREDRHPQQEHALLVLEGELGGCLEISQQEEECGKCDHKDMHEPVVPIEPIGRPMMYLWSQSDWLTCLLLRHSFSPPP